MNLWLQTENYLTQTCVSHNLKNSSCERSEVFFQTLDLSLDFQPVLLVVLTVLGEILVLLSLIEFLDAVDVDLRTVWRKYDSTLFQSPKAHDELSYPMLTILWITPYPPEVVKNHVRLVLHEHFVPQIPDQGVTEEVMPFFCAIFSENI